MQTLLTVHAGDMCDNLSKLHDFTLHRLLVEAKFLLYMHCLLVEATFLTVHAGDWCDNLSKLHDFTLHRLLMKVKFLTEHALPAG